MTKTRVDINRGVYKKGKTTYPPEVEIFIDVFDIAIGDVKGEGEYYYDVINRAESEKWLLSEHAFWVGSIIFGIDHMVMLQRWVKDGLPKPAVARKRKELYYEDPDRFRGL